jgi:hypothetical protein
MRSNAWRKGTGVAAALVSSVLACGQSWNLDLDVRAGGPEAGQGVPSSSFGGAANQVGFWNDMSATTGSYQVRDLFGNLTSVVVSREGFGSGTGFNNPTLTGDYGRLLRDGNANQSSSWELVGLANGVYKIFTYSVHPSAEVRNTSVVVPGAVVPSRLVTGPVQGNSFAEGITHTVHQITVTNGHLTIDVIAGSLGGAYVNGFQLVAVPEPSSALLLAFGLPLLLRRRKR